LLFHEPLTSTKIAAIFIIIFGVYLLTRPA